MAHTLHDARQEVVLVLLCLGFGVTLILAYILGIVTDVGYCPTSKEDGRKVLFLLEGPVGMRILGDHVVAAIRVEKGGVEDKGVGIKLEDNSKLFNLVLLHLIDRSVQAFLVELLSELIHAFLCLGLALPTVDEFLGVMLEGWTDSRAFEHQLVTRNDRHGTIHEIGQAAFEENVDGLDPSQLGEEEDIQQRPRRALDGEPNVVNALLINYVCNENRQC